MHRKSNSSVGRIEKLVEIRLGDSNSRGKRRKTNREKIISEVGKEIREIRKKVYNVRARVLQTRREN